MKEFLVYTALRIGLFIANLVLVFGIWGLVADQVPVLWATVIAFAASGIASYFLLNRQREAFAQRVDERARRMSAKLDEMKAKEDAD